MSFQVPLEVVRVFGSQARAKVLGYLANLTTPQTGYAILKSLQISVSKVYGELKRLEPTGILSKSLDSKGSTRFLLRDPDIRSFLAKRLRISSAEEWFSTGEVAKRRNAFRQAKRIPVSLRLPPAERNRRSRFVREFRRPPEKDRALDLVRRASRGGRPR